ncbi:MAG: D-glycerate dehydrogenase [Chloroflexota bacterium]
MSASATRPRILVCRPIPAAGLDPLRASCDLDVWPGPLAPSRPELLERARGAAGILVVGDRVADDLLDAAGPSLKGIAQFGVGYDNVDVAACTARGIPAGNTPGVLSETTAEIGWALLMAAARRVTEAERYLRAGRWGKGDINDLMGVDVSGATLGIVGLGRIGQVMARLSQGFRMTILYSQRNRAHPDVERALGATYVPFEELLERSDFVSVHAPSTPDTRHLIDAAALARMKPTAILVNTSRGALVDQDALLAALDAGRLRAAALDVTDPEPLPADHPLVGRDDVVVIPHIGSNTYATRVKMGRMCSENLLAALRGEPMPWVIDPAVYA